MEREPIPERRGRPQVSFRTETLSALRVLGPRWEPLDSTVIGVVFLCP